MNRINGVTFKLFLHPFAQDGTAIELLGQVLQFSVSSAPTQDKLNHPAASQNFASGHGLSQTSKQ